MAELNKNASLLALMVDYLLIGCARQGNLQAAKAAKLASSDQLWLTRPLERRHRSAENIAEGGNAPPLASDGIIAGDNRSATDHNKTDDTKQV